MSNVYAADMPAGERQVLNGVMARATGSAAATVIATVNVPVVAVVAANAARGVARGFTVTAALAQAACTLRNSRLYRVRINGAVAAAAANKSATVSIAVNGTAAYSLSLGTVGTSAVPFDVTALVEATYGDTVELMVANNTDNANLTISSGLEMEVLG